MKSSRKYSCVLCLPVYSRVFAVGVLFCVTGGVLRACMASCFQLLAWRLRAVACCKCCCRSLFVVALCVGSLLITAV